MGDQSDSIDWSLSRCFNCGDQKCSLSCCQQPLDQARVQQNKAKYEEAKEAKRNVSSSTNSSRREQAKKYAPPSPEDLREEKTIDGAMMKWDKNIPKKNSTKRGRWVKVETPSSGIDLPLPRGSFTFQATCRTIGTGSLASSTSTFHFTPVPGSNLFQKIQTSGNSVSDASSALTDPSSAYQQNEQRRLAAQLARVSDIKISKDFIEVPGSNGKQYVPYFD